MTINSYRPRRVTCELKYGIKSTYLKVLQNILTFFHFTEVLIDLFAKDKYMNLAVDTKLWNIKRRWLVIAAIEGIK